MSEPQPLERPQLLTDKVCDRLRDAIVRGELKLGEQVSEVQLATWLGVSKTPVRESLLRLKAEGLVEIQPQRGTFVFHLDAAQVAQLCHYRAMIEVAALRSALAQHPAGLESGLEACVSEMRDAEKAKDLQALAQIDMDFHHQFFVHCGDPYLRAGYAVIRSQLVALRFRSPIRNAISSHQVLLEAVRRRQANKACALLHEHVLENEARYRAACSVGCVTA